MKPFIPDITGTLLADTSVTNIVGDRVVKGEIFPGALIESTAYVTWSMKDCMVSPYKGFMRDPVTNA